MSVSIRRCIKAVGHEGPCNYGPRISADTPRDASTCPSEVRSALVKSEDGSIETAIAEELVRIQEPSHLPPETLELERLAKERSEAVTDPMIPATSPTGIAVINGSAVFLKVAAVIVGIAWVVSVSDFFPGTTMDEKIASGVLTLGALLGIASPGIRKAS